MQLMQQARLADSAGSAIEGTHDVTVTLLDGADNAHFAETFSGIRLENGYFAVQLGAGDTPLDTSVFLDHGAMDISFSVDGVVVGEVAAGGYPYVVAQQSLMAREATLQQVFTEVAAQQSLMAREATLQQISTDVSSLDVSCGEGPAYSTDCSDWEASGWSSITACRQDGRWHRYATTTGDWDSPQGHLDWREASRAGADTKLRVGREWYPVSVRWTNDSSGNYMFITDIGNRHISFRLTNGGDMTSVHATTGGNQDTFSDHWWGSGTGDFGNRHHASGGYSSRSGSTNIDENKQGGIEIWARY